MKRSAGRHPQFVPTEEQRELVVLLRGAGNQVSLIARALRTDDKTLRRHFRAELDTGKEMLVAALGNSVIRAGLNGDWRAALSWLARHCPDQWRLQGEPEPRPSRVTVEVRGGLPEWPREPAP